jgi:virginiamycin B lyase
MHGNRFALPLIVALLLLAGIPHAGAQQSDLSEFPVPTANALLQGIVTGPDGNLWVAERTANAIARVTPAGAVTEFPLPTADASPFWLAVGPDGALWFTEISGNRIGRMAVDGSVTEYPVPTPLSQPTGLAAGPDGALWFTERMGNRIGRITTGGVVTEYMLPRANSGPYGIAAGPDGAMWFTEQAGNRIGRITTGGVVTMEFPLQPANRVPSGIVAGPDGALWFVERAGQTVGRMTTAGAVTKFDLAAGSDPVDITVGPDGNLYATELGGNHVAQVTPAGAVTEFPVPTAGSQPFGITNGPGGLWFTEAAGNQVGRLQVVFDDTPPVVTISGPLDGALVTRGAPLEADYACADEDGGSGLVSCEGDVADGAMLDTSTVGSHTLSVEAVDGAGNVGHGEVGYVVVAGVTGKLAPEPAVTTVKAGSSVAVGLEMGVSAVRNVMAPGFPMSEQVSCDDPSVVLGPPGDGGKVNGSNGGHVDLVWKTDKAWAGTCRRLVLGFSPEGWNTAHAMFAVRFS